MINQVCGPLCAGCVLEDRGSIFIPWRGNGNNRVMFVGDSGWHHEANTKRWVNGQQVGTPVSGPTGWWLERNLKRIGSSLDDFLFANSYWCKAPHLGFTDAPQKYPEAALALEHCRPYLDELIERFKPAAFIPLGNVALRRIAGISGIERNHAYWVDTPYGIPAIPTFHPSYILKGNQKLSGAWCFAVERALKLASGKEKLREYRLLLDPPLAEAKLYFEQGGLETLVCDIETSDWEGDEDEAEAESKGNIVRISFSNNPGTGISVPWLPPYISLSKDILFQAQKVVFWNQQFDLPRLQASGCVVGGQVIDAMFAWHWLQSDLPKALAFVAPLFALLKPWKHLNSAQPAYYSAMDSAVTMDCYLAIRKQLEQDGRWTDFERQCIRMFPILTSMSKAGVKLDLEHQARFKGRLELERDEKLTQLQAQCPPEVRSLKHYKRLPKDMTDVVQATEGWDRMLPFNPASPLQVKNLIKHLGLKVPIVRGEDRESTESKFLKKLSKKNTIFKIILEYRERCKIIDSYCWQPTEDGRVHTQFSFHPSTWRKSARNPAIQTVPKRNDLAQEFRKMIVAAPGYLLCECDSSAIEAVLVGYFGGSERYIQLAKSGVHKWLASEYAGRPVSKSEPLYDQIKRVVHLSNYMGSPQRIHEEYPNVFANVKAARELQDFYFNTEPGKDVRAWQQATLQLAHKEHKLTTPFNQAHFFWDVFTYRDGQAVMGDDAKRAVAFRPQAAASAIQTEFVLAIEEHHTWMLPHLRWLVHDSILAEVPERDAERFARELIEVMTMPFPQLEGLSIGCEAKIGPNLASMKEVRL
jgi:uracil-DNA glycosylase family 4